MARWMGATAALVLFVLIAGCGDKDCSLRCDANGENCTSDCPETR